MSDFNWYDTFNEAQPILLSVEHGMVGVKDGHASELYNPDFAQVGYVNGKFIIYNVSQKRKYTYMTVKNVLNDKVYNRRLDSDKVTKNVRG